MASNIHMIRRNSLRKLYTKLLSLMGFFVLKMKHCVVCLLAFFALVRTMTFVTKMPRSKTIETNVQFFNHFPSFWNYCSIKLYASVNWMVINTTKHAFLRLLKSTFWILSSGFDTIGKLLLLVCAR